MSEELPWWELAKAQSLKRREVAASSLLGVNTGDTFLIVTEGEVTEPVYFEYLLEDLKLSTVSVHVQPGSDSHPFHVIKTAYDLAKNQITQSKAGKLANDEPHEFDHVWAVVDADVLQSEGQWNEAIALAKKLEVSLAYSVPCVEYWLLLHVVGQTTRADLYDGKAAKSVLEKEMGMKYNTTRKVVCEVVGRLINEWPNAVKAAEAVKKYHAGAGTTIPANPSTELCILVRALNFSANEKRRKL